MARSVRDGVAGERAEVAQWGDVVEEGKNRGNVASERLSESESSKNRWHYRVSNEMDREKPVASQVQPRIKTEKPTAVGSKNQRRAISMSREKMIRCSHSTCGLLIVRLQLILAAHGSC